MSRWKNWWSKSSRSLDIISFHCVRHGWNRPIIAYDHPGTIFTWTLLNREKNQLPIPVHYLVYRFHILNKNSVQYRFSVPTTWNSKMCGLLNREKIKPPCEPFHFAISQRLLRKSEWKFWSRRFFWEFHNIEKKNPSQTTICVFAAVINF